MQSALAPCGRVLCVFCRAQRMAELLRIWRTRGPSTGDGQVCPWLAVLLRVAVDTEFASVRGRSKRPRKEEMVAEGGGGVTDHG